MEGLVQNVIEGLKAAHDAGYTPTTVGIDTWAVDFLLLDADGTPIGDPVAYRDGRTAAMREELEPILPFTKLYARTGIQYQSFNTVYQLCALKKEHPEQLAAAEHFLMVPDYLNYRLTGVMANEYTNASTTALVGAISKDWDDEIINRLGLPRKIFGRISTPGTKLGNLSSAVKDYVGFDCTVVLPATHDTGSAFLAVPAGEVHAVMGPNGTGKSSLSKAIAGHPDYKIESGDVLMNGESLVGLPPDEIARKGFFLAFQYPVSIPGVSIANFIRACLSARLPEGETINAVEYYKELYSKMDELKMSRSFTSRSVNDGFSGGEKKRCDILQMLMLKPKFAILDETDSGLDIDALRIVSEGVNAARSPGIGMLLITHYHRLLEYIKPDKVHVMSGGKIVKSGGAELAVELEQKGYDWIKEAK